jgi:chemotaxis protein MotB
MAVSERRAVMPKRIVLPFLAVLLAAGLSACTVMQSTYQNKADEAETLTKRLAELQKRYDALAAENAALKSRNEGLLADLAGTKERLSTDLAYVTGQRDKAVADKEELDSILQSRSDTLSQTIFELRRRVVDLEKENSKLKAENASLLKAGEEQVRKVSLIYESLLEKMKPEVSQGQVTISELKGKLTVTMADSILFESGRADLKKGGRDLLGKVIPILKELDDRRIRIGGHTDNVQITRAFAQRYPTNWELSAARAINVARYLQGQGVDPGNMSAVAYGEWRPIAGNDTEEGRAKNRRIEIVLVPKE